MITHKDLPHINAYDQYQFITYRLADSLPRDIIENLCLEWQNNNCDLEKNEINNKIEDYQNAGYGSSILVHPLITDMILENWYYFSGNFYDLICWVIMPNHVHLIIKEYNEIKINTIIEKWKSFSSKQIIKLSPLIKGNIDCYIHKKDYFDKLIESRKIWQRGYWDHYLRNDEEFLILSITFIKIRLMLVWLKKQKTGNLAA